MLQIVGPALLVVVVLGGLALGPWLVAALLARRRGEPDLALVLLRRASTSAFVLGVLAIVFPLGNLVLGTAYSAGSWGLTVAGLLLIAAGAALRRPSIS